MLLANFAVFLLLGMLKSMVYVVISHGDDAVSERDRVAPAAEVGLDAGPGDLPLAVDGLQPPRASEPVPADHQHGVPIARATPVNCNTYLLLPMLLIIKD